MAKKSILYNIFNDLVTALKPIVGSKSIFLKDRPNFKEGETPMEKFIVIDLPTPIDDYVIGVKNTYLVTTGVFYLFVQSRSNNTLDVNSCGDLTDLVTGLFPINGTYTVASNPSVRLTGSDGMGFQVIMIHFDLQCKWKAFD